MDYKRLREQPIEDVLEQVQGLQAVADKSAVQSVGALVARCTIEVAGSLGNVWAGLHDVKKTLSQASAEASAQTAALVRWTKVLVIVTIAYTMITGGLLLVAILSRK